MSKRCKEQLATNSPQEQLFEVAKEYADEEGVADWIRSIVDANADVNGMFEPEQCNLTNLMCAVGCRCAHTQALSHP